MVVVRKDCRLGRTRRPDGALTLAQRLGEGGRRPGEGGLFWFLLKINLLLHARQKVGRMRKSTLHTSKHCKIGNFL